jgi:hypothetical protein
LIVASTCASQASRSSSLAQILFFLFFAIVQEPPDFAQLFKDIGHSPQQSERGVAVDDRLGLHLSTLPNHDPVRKTQFRTRHG